MESEIGARATGSHPLLERIRTRYPTRPAGWADLAIAIQQFLPGDEPTMAAGFIANAVITGIEELPGGPFGSATFVAGMAGNALAPIMPGVVPVVAEFDKLDGSGPELRAVKLELGLDGYIRMRGGPTGYESLPVDGAVRDFGSTVERPWAANFGGSGYASCQVPFSEMRKALQAFGLLPAAA